MRHMPVAVAVIRRPDDSILIAKRLPTAYLGGVWEFPGGKVEASESIEDALQREIKEELDIEVSEYRPLITVTHAYPDRTVYLQVFEVTQFRGEPKGREGQTIRWVSRAELAAYTFPPASEYIITALNLPEYYAITEEAASESEYIAQIDHFLSTDIKLIQLRAKNLDEAAVQRIVNTVSEGVSKKNARLLVNADANTSVEASGIHLTSQSLLQYDQRPIPNDKLLGVSCHSTAELEYAEKIGADFIVLSPVQEAKTDSFGGPMGWEMFANLVKAINIPVYALGGVSPQDLSLAKKNGAQGIAGIRCFSP